MIDPLKVLKHWADVTQYDPEQKKFNILSSTYEFHRVGERIESILQFDPSGVFALLYAKCSFETIAKGMKCSLIDLCKCPDMVKEYQDLWAEFCSQDMIDFEKQTIENIVKVTSLRPALGEADIESEIDQFRDSIEYVAEELIRCHTEIYSGENIDTRLSDEIHVYKTLHVFNTTSECVLNLEQAPDGMYPCYITEFDSCGGYFGYFIKFGEVLFSLNDRIGERFVGEHTRSRNNRFIEDKKWHIFPYKDIVSLEGSDYKGYAKSLVCEVKPYNICEFSSSSVCCIMLSMCLVLARYQGRTIQDIKEDKNTDVVFIDSLLNNNLHSNEVQALIPKSVNSLILNKHKHHIDLCISSESLASNECQKDFDRASNQSKDYREKGFYGNINEDLVHEYGSNFKVDADSILKRSWPQLTSGETSVKNASDVVISEYIATEGQMKLEWYRQARIQLRDHILKKMREDALAAGGTEGIRKWYADCVHKNSEYFRNEAIKWYSQYLKGEVSSRYIEMGSTWCTVDPVVSLKTGPDGFHNYMLSAEFILNDPKTYENSWYGRHNHAVETYKSYGDDTTANMWFIFAPSSYNNLQKYVGEDVQLPKILKYWVYNSHEYRGNSLIDSCDPVSFILNPFAHIGSYDRKQFGFDEFDDIMFTVGIGFSKRELNRLLKQYSEENR